MISFVAYTAADTLFAFRWAGKPEKLPISVGGCLPRLKLDSLCPPISPPFSQWHLNWFSRCCRTYACDQHRHTDRPRYMWHVQQ